MRKAFFCFSFLLACCLSAQTPGLSLEKYTNGQDADAADNAVELEYGDPVVWDYVISNTGETLITNIFLLDDKEGFICSLTNLDIGQSDTCSKAGVATELFYSNLGFASGIPVDEDGNLLQDKPVTAEDSSHYLIPPIAVEAPDFDYYEVEEDPIRTGPSLQLEKWTNGFDSDQLPGSQILTYGEAITWTYIVTNTGDADIIDISILDDKEGFVCSINQLDIGQSDTCFLTGTATEYAYGNLGFASGTPIDESGNPAGDKPVVGEDSSHYLLLIEDFPVEDEDGSDGEPIEGPDEGPEGQTGPEEETGDVEEDGQDGEEGPTEPEVAETPETPENPETSEEENDGEEGPTEPEDNPETPQDSETPDDSETPEDSTPETPDDSETPNDQETPDDPETPLEPEDGETEETTDDSTESNDFENCLTDCPTQNECLAEGESSLVICADQCGSSAAELLFVDALYHCSIVDLGEGCFRYTPLPGMTHVMEGESLTAYFGDGDDCWAQEINISFGCDDCDNTIYADCIMPVTPTDFCPEFCNLPDGYTIVEAHTVVDCGIVILDECIRYTGLPGFMGDEVITVTACYEDQCESLEIHFSVGDCTENDPPNANDDDYVTEENQDILLDVLNNDSDPDGDDLSFCNEADDLQAENGTVTISNGQLEYDPDPNFVGNDEFTYTICDEEGNSDQATVYITIEESDGSCDLDAEYCVGPTELLEICIDWCEDDSEILNVITLFGCSISDVTDDCFSYRSLPGFIGWEEITVYGCDGNDCEIATIDVHVNADCGDAPEIEAVDDSFITDDEHNLLLDILINDDYDCANPEIEILSEPSSGLVVDVTGVLTYVPEAGFEGEVVFDYEICCSGICDQATVTISVLLDGPCDANFRVPQVFSPNSDGINDAFKVSAESCFESNFELKVFDESGLLIFEERSTENTILWNGRTSGSSSQLLGNGVYFYTISKTNSTDNRIQKSGFIQLQK